MKRVSVSSIYTVIYANAGVLNAGRLALASFPSKNREKGSDNEAGVEVFFFSALCHNQKKTMLTK